MPDGVSFEVTFDPVFAMYVSGAGTTYAPERHEVLHDPPWLESVKREFGRPKLFQYRHRDTGNFVLAEWVARPNECRGPGLFIELEAYPDRDTYPTREYLHLRFRPADEQVKEVQKRVAARRREVMELKKESRRDAIKAARRLRNMGLDHEASLLAEGAMPYVGDAEANDDGASKHTLNHIARS